MKLASLSVLTASLILFGGGSLSASEAATDCDLAREILLAGIEEHPGEFLDLFRDSLQTNPACSRVLFMAAAQAASGDEALLEKVIFIVRDEFPDDSSSLAEAALLAVPGAAETVRAAFFAGEEKRQSALALAARSAHPGLVALPADAVVIDEDIREAIARIAAKVEGKLWLEQEVAKEEFRFRQPDEVRVPRRSRNVDESSLENGLPVVLPELAWSPEEDVFIDDAWKPSDAIHLDESRFAKSPPPELAEAKDDDEYLRPLDAILEELAPAGYVARVEMGAQVAGEDFVPLDAESPLTGEEDHSFLQLKIDSLLPAP